MTSLASSTPPLPTTMTKPGISRRIHATRRMPTTTTKTRAQRVPNDCFGYIAPESKAAHALTNLWTMCAVRVVLAQEEGYDNEGAPTELSRALGDFLHEHPLRDGREWLTSLMSHESTLLRLAAVRIMEVRAAYGKEDFDFARVQREAIDFVVKENDALTVEYVKKSM
jgi:hypothetical protein